MPVSDRLCILGLPSLFWATMPSGWPMVEVSRTSPTRERLRWGMGRDIIVTIGKGRRWELGGRLWMTGARARNARESSRAVVGAEQER